jgi:hypothetical protein
MILRPLVYTCIQLAYVTRRTLSLFQRHTKNIILGSAPGLVMTVGDDSEDWSLGKMM